MPKYPKTNPAIPSGTPQIGKNQEQRLIMPNTSEAIAIIRLLLLLGLGADIGMFG
jgi:hypothetical protein